jgi:hypothetical protein
MAKNVLGTDLETCGTSPLTGFYRDGCCNTGPGDFGLHLICAEMTQEFLEFSQQRGNDLITPVPASAFPGLKAGDRWCLCAQRWKKPGKRALLRPLSWRPRTFRRLSLLTSSN